MRRGSPSSAATVALSALRKAPKVNRKTARLNSGLASSAAEQH
jgi:hypothetical protein